MRLIWTSLRRRPFCRVTLTFLYVLVGLVVLLQLQPLLSSLSLRPFSTSTLLTRDSPGALSRLVAGDSPGQVKDGSGVKVNAKAKDDEKVEAAGRGEATGKHYYYNVPDCSVTEFLASPDPTARAAFSQSLVCGTQARDRDVVCSLFFSQIGLHDDGDCLREHDDTKVPRIVYFVIFGDYLFKFWHYVSIVAAKRYVNPSALYVIGDAHPTGYWWQRVMRDCKGVRFVYRSRPNEIGRQPVKFRHHLSDLVRLQVLLLNGGIYLDTDMVMTRDPEPILKHDITMGLIENGTGMGNAFIAAKRNSPFIREWYEHYNRYNNSQFFGNSLHVPRDMWHKNASRLHMESERLYRPNWFEADKLFKGWDYDWSRNYAVHVWTNGNAVPRSEEEVQTSNTTIAQVFRNALYGDPAPREIV